MEQLGIKHKSMLKSLFVVAICMAFDCNALEFLVNDQLSCRQECIDSGHAFFSRPLNNGGKCCDKASYDQLDVLGKSICDVGGYNSTKN